MSFADSQHPDAKNSIIFIFKFVIPSETKEPVLRTKVLRKAGSLFLEIMRKKILKSHKVILKGIPYGMTKTITNFIYEI